MAVKLDVLQTITPAAEGLQDACGRRVRYLRLSVTPACSMRCIYCRPAAHGGGSGPSLMSPAEITLLVQHLVQRHGLRKVRLTGGEPAARADLLEIIARLGRLEGLLDLALTTNGLTLGRDARAMVAAGLRRVNVSLDSLHPETFARMTGVVGLERVLAGIDAACAAGLAPLKLNCVVVRGENERDLPDLVHFAAARGLEMRFIELMPMGPLAEQWAQRHVGVEQMRALLDETVAHWQPLPRDASSATRYRVTLRTGGRATVGLITAMSCPFCAACGRIRIASDGGYYPCLMDRPHGNLLPALRPTLDRARLDDLLVQGLARKQPEHPCTGMATMTYIGG